MGGFEVFGARISTLSYPQSRDTRMPSRSFLILLLVLAVTVPAIARADEKNSPAPQEPAAEAAEKPPQAKTPDADQQAADKQAAEKEAAKKEAAEKKAAEKKAAEKKAAEKKAAEKKAAEKKAAEKKAAEKKAAEEAAKAKEAEEKKKADKLFPDPGLEAAVRAEVFEKRYNDEPLTKEDVQNISRVVGRGKEIKSLAGLQHCHAVMLIDL